jgi:hypothetical protein
VRVCPRGDENDRGMREKRDNNDNMMSNNEEEEGGMWKGYE